MAILSTSNLLSEQRYDISDARRIESAVRNDFDTAITSIITNTYQGYIIRGFSILTAGSIGSAANGLQMSVDPGAVLNINASVSGTIFQTPTGTPNQTLNAATNINVSGSFTANSTNYIGIDYNRFADPSTNVTKYIWSASSNDEIQTIAPAAQTLTYKIYITTSVWAPNVLPVAIVTTDSNGNVVSITDARWMLYSLETGGLNPNPGFTYPWSAGRTQPPTTINSGNSSQNPFVGGDKQLTCLKDWMDAVMSSFLEVKGTPNWFSGTSGGGVLPSLTSLFQDLANTVITGAGEISNGVLPGSDPILVTTGTTTYNSNQITGLASVAGLSIGDYIFGTGIPQGSVIQFIGGSTITMSQLAAFTTVGIGISFYSPSAITSSGQINWDKPINIRVIGSSLTYVLAANPSSADISLTDDQVAYVTLIRDVPISPNLIFVSGSPTLVSVGAVSWTSSLLPGDYVKVATNSVSDYYKILTVDSSSQVTLTSNVSLADNSGATGSKAQYAFGSYTAVAIPSTNRNIYISSRGTVPSGGNVFWLYMREDNGGSPRVYIRFLSQELDNGESVEVSGTTSIELLQYIGAPSAASSKPNYTGALIPGSLPQITDITVGSGASITSSQYFLINSSANSRAYFIWFQVNGSGLPPSVAHTNASVQVNILSSDTAAQVASKLANALNSALDFSASAVGTNLVVTNTSAGTCTAAAIGTMTGAFTISTAQSGTGVGNYFVHDGDNLTLAIKELDEAVGILSSSTNINNYDETVEIVASGGTPPTSLTGPISPGTYITLPDNSRESNVPEYYVVGSGDLMVFLNGQFLDFQGGAYAEIGAFGAVSDQIEILIALVVGDELEFRINASGTSGTIGPTGPAGPVGPTGPTGMNSAGGPVSISTKTGNYTILTTDCFLAADCTSGPITFTLPAASGNTGRIFYCKKVDSTANSLTIVGSGSDIIDQSSSFIMTSQDQSGSFISRGSVGYWVF